MGLDQLDTHPLFPNVAGAPPRRTRMGKVIIQHIDDAAYLSGEPRKPGEPMPQAAQLIGDLDEGPWIHINSARAGTVAAPTPTIRTR